MASGFEGFPAEGLKFFRQLAKNNNREWFQPRKSVYEETLRQPMIRLVENINQQLARFAPEHGNDPKKAIYRLYRDTRFSKDKTPYKIHIGAIFPRRGLDKHGGAGYYFHVSASEVVIAGGVYMPGTDELLAIRTHLAEHYKTFEKLARGRKLKRLLGELQGEQLTRAPKGFDPDHPAVDLLRHKQWHFYTNMPADVATTPELQKAAVERFRAMSKFVDFLNEPLLAMKRNATPDPLTTRAPSSRRR